MEHNEAVRMLAVEGYLLGDLDPATEAAFETHLFECQECQEATGWAEWVIDALRVVLARGL